MGWGERNWITIIDDNNSKEAPTRPGSGHPGEIKVVKVAARNDICIRILQQKVRQKHDSNLQPFQQHRG